MTLEPRPLPLALAVGGAIIAFAVLVTWALFQQDIHRQSDRRTDAALRLATMFDHELSIRAHTVRAMQLMAQQCLEGRAALVWDPTRYLRAVPAQHGFTLDLPKGYGSKDLGNITGLGPLPLPDSVTAREMAAALSLTPLFKATMERDPETPWIYYTSARDFMYLYPRVEPQAFFYSAQLHDLSFIKGARPTANPKREVFWTQAYQDAAGKGWLVTVSAPVYEHETFRGAVSIDISVDKLAGLLQHYALPNSEIHLVSGDGRSLIAPRTPPLAIRPDALPANAVVEAGEHLVMAIPLQVKDWYIVVKTDRASTILEAVKHSAAFGLVVLFLCGAVLLAFLLAKALDKVGKLSVIDALTGLYNRRMYDSCVLEEFGHARRYKSPFGLILFDVDHFKKYNDAHGHQAGDRVLRAIAATVTSTLKRSTDKVFRVGGEEFAVLVRVSDRSELTRIAERIGAAVRALDIPHPGSPTRRVTVSLGGLALEGEPWLTPDECYFQADAALYRAKKGGRDCFRVVSNTEEARRACS